MDEECGGILAEGIVSPPARRRRSSIEVAAEKVKGFYEGIISWLRDKFLAKREVGVANKFFYDEQLGKWRMKNEREEDIIRRQEEQEKSFTHLSNHGTMAGSSQDPLPPPPTNGPVTLSGNRSNTPWAYTDWTTGETIAMGQGKVAQGQLPHYTVPGQEPVIASPVTSFPQQAQAHGYPQAAPSAGPPPITQAAPTGSAPFAPGGLGPHAHASLPLGAPMAHQQPAANYDLIGTPSNTSMPLQQFREGQQTQQQLSGNPVVPPAAKVALNNPFSRPASDGNYPQVLATPFGVRA